MISTARTSPLFRAVVRPIAAFFAREAASGILLILSATVALVWANIDDAGYRAFFDTQILLGAGGASLGFSLHALINDGLMGVFFFVVGLEIKRELTIGELRTPARAALPAIAALGGMVLPAAIYLALNWSGPGTAGWGVPVATDIAFCVGVLTLLGHRVPHGLKVFLVALAIFDDIGGILIIALFYGGGVDGSWLAASAGMTGLLLLMNRAHVGHGLVYGLLGLALWFGLHHAGIHATIASVIVALAVPASAQRGPRAVLEELSRHVEGILERPADIDLEGAELAAIEDRLEELTSPLDRFVHLFHPFVAFGIMPLFALANAGVSVAALGIGAMAEPVALGAALGLFVGKPVGIFSFTLAAIALSPAPMPSESSRAQLFGVSILAGIGFTVSLFIATLAFADESGLLDQAKFGVLTGSMVAGAAGAIVLAIVGRRSPPVGG